MNQSLRYRLKTGRRRRIITFSCLRRYYVSILLSYFIRLLNRMYLKAIFGIIAAFATYYILSGVQNVLNPEEVLPPTLPEDVWWGARSRESIKDDKIRPFTISASNHVLEHLKNRLKITKFPVAPFEDANFQYGFNINYLKNVTSYWLNNYDWDSRLKFLNSFPHFKTYVSGLDIHFIHVKPDISARTSLKIVPILLLHGWPGSVREFYELIPLLTTPRENQDFVFEAIVPSLPGYGFSEGAAYPGMSTTQMGIIFKKLMEKLGHKKFYIHGGDWGSFIGNDMSILYPVNVLGFHSTLCGSSNKLNNLIRFLGSYWPRLVVDEEHEHRMYPISNTVRWLYLETGYMHEQATKPDTIEVNIYDEFPMVERIVRNYAQHKEEYNLLTYLREVAYHLKPLANPHRDNPEPAPAPAGTALMDTPVGLAAYILEKFSTWTNPAFKDLPDGGLTKKFTLNALLDNVMIYWITESILTSVRLYSENLSLAHMAVGLDLAFVKVPTICAQFPYEVGPYYTPEMLQRKYTKLVKISEFNDGGHFAAFELPNIVSEDLWTSIPLFVAANT